MHGQLGIFSHKDADLALWQLLSAQDNKPPLYSLWRDFHKSQLIISQQQNQSLLNRIFHKALLLFGLFSLFFFLIFRFYLKISINNCLFIPLC
jgi:hypothetical protein